ncbi:hypothetical protein [Lewinella cohaerens]|uniref:hypothetical protein n=1 Tax=Lewinella cohaerens TaxID=70995 RepID=UPI0003828D27|nr:hypothetical protein [Lewinella cohaerens]
MHRKLSLLFFLSGMAILAVSCGGDKAAEDGSDEDGINITVENDEGETESINIDLGEGDMKDLQNGLADAFAEASESLRKNAENGESVEVMNFRDIKAILPDKLLGMDRTKHTGEKTGAMGFTISQAEAEYEEDDKSIEVQVVDAGQMGIAKLGMVAWASVEVDREGDFGYERTTEIDGHKAFEKWNADSGVGELIFFYDDRFIITLKGRKLGEDDLRKALNRIDYEDLE